MGAGCVMKKVGVFGPRGIDKSEEILEIPFVDRSGLLANRLEDLECVFGQDAMAPRLAAPGYNDGSDLGLEASS
jgi:hypothetical protein